MYLDVKHHYNQLKVVEASIIFNYQKNVVRPRNKTSNPALFSYTVLNESPREEAAIN